jgi:glycosyltransferase involved in cell wall biosynthesis
VKLNTLKYCVIIPTYNNELSLLAVIQDVRKYTDAIIIVNDGSTDNTEAILASVSGLTIVSYEKNQGKGKALREGFKKAIELGYTHAITIDSDGQHKGSDLPGFFKAIEEDPQALFIGSRNMNQSNVPGTSSFGNNFSNFWFKFETGIDAPDTQSGFRSYPIHLYKNIHFYTKKYEFEIEVIVRSAWKDIPIKFVPIDVYYPPQEERISHFRKIPDFTRISILNTFLVTLAILYYKPRNFLRKLKKKA